MAEFRKKDSSGVMLGAITWQRGGLPYGNSFLNNSVGIAFRNTLD